MQTRYQILAALILLAGCASTRTPGSAPNERIYAADLPTTLEEVSDAFALLRLNIEEQGWAVPDERYEISGYELDRVFRGAEGTVRSATVLVVVERVDDARTRVTMETTRRDRPSMASSAGSTVDHEREFFAHLDELLPAAPYTP